MIFDLWYILLFILWWFFGETSSSSDDDSEAPPSGTQTNSFSHLWSDIEGDNE